jgi:predicted  nucleic acid-binding Zn-ribbon protein
MRLQRALSTDDKREIAALEIDIAILETDMQDLTDEKTALATDLARANTSWDGIKTGLEKLGGEYHALETKHPEERSKLEQAAVKQRRLTDAIALELADYKHAVGVLIAMSEREGMQLDVAVALA